MTWQRPGVNEESEPKSTAATKEKDDIAKLLPPPSPTAAPMRSSRRWPPAYVAAPPRSHGRPGAVVFDDDPPPPSHGRPGAVVFDDDPPPPSHGRPGAIVFDDDPPPKPAVATIATSRPVAPAELQRQIKSLCGRQARDVSATVQRDGTVLIRVKVPNRSIEDQLSRKILALPEMNSSRMQLLIEIEP